MNTLFKKGFYLGTRLSQVLGSNLPKNETKKIVFTPVFENEQKLADQVNRIKWYLPEPANVTIWISLSEKLRNVNLSDLEVPDHQRRPSNITNRPKIQVCRPEELDDHIKDADIFCIWNTEKVSLLKYFLRHPLRMRILDPNFYRYTESHTSAALLWYDLYSKRQKREAKKQSYLNFKKLVSQYQTSPKAYLFGTGPSIEQATNYNFDDGVRIVCNTVISNEELLEILKPNIITFADCVFHFGVSKYCERFAEDLKKVVNKYQCHIVTTEVGAALMRAHCPDLRPLIIGVPATKFSGPQILTDKSFKTRSYPYSIVTRFMIPLAAGLSKQIYMIGFDGREPNDKYFWKHNDKAQYSDNMQDVRLAHPAFFNDTDYSVHYQNHCKVLTKMVNNFEQRGVQIKVLGHSHVPVLKKRLVVM